MTRTLQQMLNDNSQYLYLIAVHYVLIEVNRVNLIFQQDSTEIFKAYLEIYFLLLTLTRMIVKPIFLNDIEDMSSKNLEKNYGILNNDLSLISPELIEINFKFREACQNINIPAEVISAIKLRCRDFILTLCKEIVKRLPNNIRLFQAVKNFTVENSLNYTGRPSFEQLPILDHTKDLDLCLLESQWKIFINVNWYTDNNTMSSETFWIRVYSYKNAGGQFIFRELANFAITALSLPLSNAVVERVFSTMNFIKSKVRNKIDISLLDALLRLKTYFNVEKICCNTFVPSMEMLQKFNVNMYKQKNDSASCKETDTETDTLDLFFDDI
nr:PREDICTED: uncharacterized protein LOC107398961 [Tribolium castaneum]|eukprot:XP_015840033.1 PREDICTED: uncharacterized protein LOC107398961 [Tribolium castaneum]